MSILIANKTSWEANEKDCLYSELTRKHMSEASRFQTSRHDIRPPSPENSIKANTKVVKTCSQETSFNFCFILKKTDQLICQEMFSRATWSGSNAEGEGEAQDKK